MVTAITTVYGNPSVPQSINDDLIQVGPKKIAGVKYPLQATSRGYFSRATGKELLKSELTQFIRTEAGERVMLPKYGLSLRKYLFMPLDEQLATDIKEEVFRGFARYLPHISIINFKIFQNDKINYQGLPGLVIKLFVRSKERGTMIDFQIEL